MAMLPPMRPRPTIANSIEKPPLLLRPPKMPAALVRSGRPERIHSNDAGRDGRRELPAEDLLAEIEAVAQAERHHWLAGRLQRLYGRIQVVPQPLVHEQPVRAVAARRADTVDRLSGEAAALGHLHGPFAEGRDGRRDDDGHLLAAGEAGFAQDGAEPRAGVVGRRDDGHAVVHHVLGAAQQPGDVHPSGGAGHEAEVRERPELTGDVLGIEERPAELVGGGEVRQPGAGRGHHHEVIAVRLQVPQMPVRILLHGGRSRLAGVDYQRVGVQLIQLGRGFGVDGAQLRIAVLAAERLGVDLDRRIDAGRADEHRLLEARRLNVLAEALKVVGVLQHQLGDGQPTHAVLGCLGSVRAGVEAPVGAVLVPHLADGVGLGQRGQSLVDGRLEAAERRLLAAGDVVAQRFPLGLDDAHQRVEGFLEELTPSSSSSWVTSAMWTPRLSSWSSARLAASTSCSSVASTSPWSWKAVTVAGGAVLTVSRPISSSMYSTSEYLGFLVPVLAHRGRWTAAPRSRKLAKRWPVKVSLNAW